MVLMDRIGNFKSQFSSFDFSKKIISINIFVFVISVLLYITGYHIIFFDLFSLDNDILSKPWSIITYSFIHGFEYYKGTIFMNGLSSLFDLLWMIVFLTFSSNAIKNLLGEKIVINLFFLGVIIGGVVFIIFNKVNSPLIGASAGYSSLLMFLLFVSPNLSVRVFAFNIKFKYLMILFLIFDFLSLFSGHFGVYAHIGGYMVGVFYYYYLYGLPKFDNKRKNINKRKITPNKQSKVDSILDKISKSGYDSLDDEEKEFLFKQGNKK
tara:strand:+ start:16034 stop:16831 length:798 start_codon:yes stop_codon:yes gene_type:complete